jgi:hypothetical protein
MVEPNREDMERAKIVSMMPCPTNWYDALKNAVGGKPEHNWMPGCDCSQPGLALRDHPIRSAQTGWSGPAKHQRRLNRRLAKSSR